jgi:hypothetical protein
MPDQVDGRQTRQHRNRVVLVTLLVAIAALLGCVGVGVSLDEARQFDVGRYRVSYWRPPGNTCVLLTMSRCEGSIRHVTTYGLRHPAIWTPGRVEPFLYNAYSKTDPNCLDI